MKKHIVVQPTSNFVYHTVCGRHRYGVDEYFWVGSQVLDSFRQYMPERVHQFLLTSDVDCKSCLKIFMSNV